MEIERTKITLRRATISDIELIIDYRIIFLTESQDILALENESFLRQSLRDYLTNSMENESFLSWIAEYDGKAVGFSGMVIREQPGNLEIPQGKTGYILNMFTIKEYRKNGIASLLFHKLIEEARLRNVDRIDLHATKDGEPIYRRFGFAEPHDKVLEFVLK
jgi:GNAT superfamily N-acetyltransferase